MASWDGAGEGLVVTGLGKLGKKCQLIVTAHGSQPCVGGSLGVKVRFGGHQKILSSLVTLSKWVTVAGAEKHVSICPG